MFVIHSDPPVLFWCARNILPEALWIILLKTFESIIQLAFARSRKHVEKYYNTTEIGKFPERLKPISKRPNLTELNSAINYNG